MKEELKEYYQSSEWKQKAQRIKTERNYTCEICGNHILLEVVNILNNAQHPSWEIPEITRFTELIFTNQGNPDRLIVVHHKTYKHLYHEVGGELACLCKPCHTYFHENTTGNDYSLAWEKTKNKVRDLLKNINNKPDGKCEFSKVKFSEQWGISQHKEMEELKRRVKAELNLNIDALGDEFFLFAKDHYDIESDLIDDNE